MSDISMTRRTILATGLVGLATALLPIRSALAAYPEQTIKWIVAYAAGGGTDTLARILAETLMVTPSSRPTTARWCSTRPCSANCPTTPGGTSVRSA
jgi:hypothetical protein